MSKSYSYFAMGCVALASLASCSRSHYALQPAASAYHGTVVAHTKIAVSATPVHEVPASDLTASVEAAPAVVQRSAVAEAASRTATVEAVAAKALKVQESASSSGSILTKATKIERKATKQAKKIAEGQAEGGKSQLTALLLAIFLGSFGVSRFYLGYTGRGFLYIGLFLGSFITFGISGLVLLVLNIIDIVKIITGDLKPKAGDYAKKFNE